MSLQTLYENSLAAATQDYLAQGLQRLFVTSSETGEGKTTVAVELAYALATTGRESVVIVDADAYAPGVHHALGLPHGRGLTDLLEQVYLMDLASEDPAQFGIGDWLELLRAQARTGEFRVEAGEHGYALRFVRGKIVSVAAAGHAPEMRLGELMIERGWLAPEQLEDALPTHEGTGRPLGEVLSALGWITPEHLDEALRLQANHRLLRLLALPQPRCGFSEMAESYLPAVGGRTPRVAAGEEVDTLVQGRFHAALRHPFLASQVPSYLSDTALPNLKALTAGERPCDLLSKRHLRPFAMLLERLGRTFDVVLVDGPPVSLGSPAAPIAALAHGVLLVVKADETEVASVRRAVEELRRGGGNVLGVVLNQAEVSRVQSS